MSSSSLERSLKETDRLATTDDGDSIFAKIVREAYVVGGGTLKGFADAAEAAVNSPGKTAIDLGISLAIGGGLAYLGRGAGIGSLMARGAAGGLTFQFVRDIADGRRLNTIQGAMADTWRSEANKDKAFQTMSTAVGPLAFNTAIGITGGALGGYLGGRTFGRSTLMENKSPILGGGGLSLRTGIDAVTRPNLVHETPALLLEQKPLNVFSRSPEPLGRDLSNFAHTPFTLDGKPYASVEGFYVSLLFRDPVKRAEVAQLHGAEAKKVGKGSNLTETTYEGQTFKLGSDTHHELIMRALRAKLEQHPDISAGLVATGSRPIIHDTGLANGSRRGFLTNETFAKMLTELRSELARKSQL